MMVAMVVIIVVVLMIVVTMNLLMRPPTFLDKHLPSSLSSPLSPLNPRWSEWSGRGGKWPDRWFRKNLYLLVQQNYAKYRIGVYKHEISNFTINIKHQMLQYKKFGFLGESPRLAKSGQMHFSKIKLSTFSTSGDKRREKSHMLNSVLLDASVLTLRFDSVKCWVTIFFIFEQFYPILYSTLAFVHNIFICIHGYSTPYELNTQQYILKIWNSKCVFIKTVFHLSKENENDA